MSGPVAERSDATPRTTRDVLLDTAERMFAEAGVDPVSIRAINAAAGQSPASMHYHFGGKDALVEAVLLRRGVPLRAEILERAAALADRPGPPDPRELVEALAIPHARVIRVDPVGGRHWNRIVAQLSVVHDERLTRHSEQVRVALEALAARAFPDVPPRARARRWYVAMSTVLQMLGHLDAPGVHDDARDRPLDDDYVAGLTDFVVAGLADAMRVAAESPAESPAERAR